MADRYGYARGILDRASYAPRSGAARCDALRAACRPPRAWATEAEHERAHHRDLSRRPSLDLQSEYACLLVGYHLWPSLWLEERIERLQAELGRRKRPPKGRR